MPRFCKTFSKPSDLTGSIDIVVIFCNLIPFTDSSVTLVNVEHQLMYMYDADVIRHLVKELIQNQGKTPQSIMSMNEKV